MSPLLFKRVSDESLGSRLASGEAAAFDELYRRYSNRLAAYGSHLLGDAASGDDVAQATMLKAYAALREGRVPERMKPWLFRIAHNTAIDLVVRRRELPSGDLPDAPSADREPFAGALVEALATLPDRQRRVYVLREVHGLRIDETAAELGLEATQVEQSLFAARNRLAEQLVFGDRLNCVAVQRLSAGPLDAPERRALKTHLRTCAACRETLGLRGRALSLFPNGMGLEWLRGLGAGLVGGGAPAAAKVGAVFATATIVGGGTVAVEQTARGGHANRPAIQLVENATASTAPPARQARVPAAVNLAALPVALPRRPGKAAEPNRDGAPGDGHELAAAGSGAQHGDSGDSGSTDAHAGSGPAETDPGHHASGGGDAGGEGAGSAPHGGGDQPEDGGSHRSAGSSPARPEASHGDSGSGGDPAAGEGSGHGGDPAAGDGSGHGGDTGEASAPGDGSGSSDGSGSESGSGSGSDGHSGDAATTALATLPVPVAVTTP